jgi:RND family efflux transporter MFP subunit
VKTRRVTIIVSGLLVLAVIVGLAALRAVRARAVASETTLAAVPVVVEEATVRRGTLRESRRFLGELMAAEQPPLSARIMAHVVDVGVREGDRVAAGTPLVELDPRELDDGVAMAEAALVAAREGQAASQVALAAQRESTARDEVLVEAGAISREAWDRSSAALAAAQARDEAASAQLTAAERALDSARTRRGYATIVAPFDGVVAARLVDRGDLAVPGKPLLALLPASGMRVRVKVPVETLVLLEPGTPVTCLPEGGSFEARVARVFPAADSSRLGTFEAGVPADAPPLVAGTTMEVELGVDSPEALIVPRDAVLEGAQGAFVFVLDQGRVHQVPVRVVARTATEVAVDAPIDEGSTVVVAQASRLMLLAEGTAVQLAGSLATR